MSPDLIDQLRALARYEHDDVAVAAEAAAELTRMEAALATIVSTPGVAYEMRQIARKALGNG
jgi:hypothetical protein